MPCEPKTIVGISIVVAANVLLGLFPGSGRLFAAAIPVTDANVLNGLSPYNWVCRNDYIGSAVNGASITVQFKGTQRVALQIDTAHSNGVAPKRLPIIAWSVNGGAVQTHQIAANETTVQLSADIRDPLIELYIKGMSPLEDRFSGDVPQNSVKITGWVVDDGASTAPAGLPAKVWLNIGDSIMSGDGAAYAKGQGRPPDDSWASSDDGRASYGYLLAHHYGYRESRIAFGGYDWGGGLANVPPLDVLIDRRTSTVSRLHNDLLDPIPAVVLINLGENGPPADASVIKALTTLRSRVNADSKILVMIPISGGARAQITRAFGAYKDAAKDPNAFLVDLGHVTFATCDGQHPTAEGHRTVYDGAIRVIDPIVEQGN